MNRWTIKVPGKLMVAGEFAVLIPNHHLAVTAVNRFVYARVEATESGSLTLEDYELNQLKWTFTAGTLHIESEDERISFVKEAMELTCNYLVEKGIKIEPFSLSVRSELDDASGVKYGLGSSAAVVVATVTAVMRRFYEQEIDRDIIFKLAALAHVNVQGSGSGADVAASVYGGILKYSSFQAEWLLDTYAKATSLCEVIERDWTYLSIKQIRLPSSIFFCVGWTGEPASTKKLVGHILQLREDKPEAFKEFLQESERAVQMLLTGMEEENESLLFRGVKANREALATVGKQAQVSIETPDLRKLSDLAEELGGAGKSSGAGGGDCGIAFMPTKEAAQRLYNAWETSHIRPLPLQSHPEGATTEKR